MPQIFVCFIMLLMHLFIAGGGGGQLVQRERGGRQESGEGEIDWVS